MKPYLFFSFFFLACFFLHAQSPQHWERWKTANKVFRETGKIGAETYREVMTEWEFENRKDTVLVDCYLKLGMYYSYEEKEPRSALKYFKEALRLAQQIPAQNPPFLQIHKEIGDIFHFELQESDSALFFYKKAEKYVPNAKNLHIIAYLYNSIAYTNQDLGQLNLALHYYHKQLVILQKLNAKESFVIENIVNTYNNIGELYRDLGEYEKALEMYLQALNSPYFQQKTYLESTEILQPYQLYNNIGATYAQLDQPHFALDYFQKALIELPKYKKDDSFYGLILKNIGKVYLQKGDLEKAKQYLEQSIAKNKNHSLHLVHSYMGMSELAQKQQDLEKALDYTQKALLVLCPTFQATNVLENPKDLTTFSNLELFRALRRKAELLALRSPKAQNNINASAALHTYEIALKFAERLRKRYFHDETKLFFQKEISPSYEKAIRLALSLGEKEKAFQFAENNKAAVLAEAVQKIRWDHLLDKKLLAEEKANRHEIVQLEQRIVETQNETEKKAITEKLSSLWIRQAQIESEYEKNPQYQKLKYAENPITIKMVQNEVLYDDSTALVEYFVGREKLYAFVISKTSFQVFETPLQSDLLRKQIVSLSDRLTKYQLDDQIRKDAATLYNTILAPIRHVLPRRVIFVPDAELNYLSFDMLISNFQKTRYLFYDHISSRTYSARLLYQAIKDRKPAQKINSILAIAPFAYQPESATIAVKRSDLLPLPKSIEEMRYLKSFGAKVFEKTAAIKDSILSLFKEYDIIHFATHAVANDSLPDQSFIACYPDSTQNWRIYTSDLYELNLKNAKLVVLSACQTGRGALRQGEGVMSLARGFTYAGCPNIAFSLWNANDEASFQIFTTFHEYLQKGLPKDEALQKAKLDYFNKGMRNREPFYWACFEFQGDAAPVYEPSGLDSIFWIVGVWAGLLLLFLIYRFVKRRK